MNKRAYINPAPSDIPLDAPTEQVKIEFAKRLQRAMVERGWNQSELARRAEERLPSDKKSKRRTFGRDKISMYIRGKTLPTPVYLEALCKALGKTTEELLPTRGRLSVVDKAPPLDFRQLEDGNVWLRVNQAVSMDVALQIVQILKKEDHEDQ